VPEKVDLERIVSSALDHAMSKVERVEHALTSLLLPSRRAAHPTKQPGAPPGIEHIVQQIPKPADSVSLRCVDYSPDRQESFETLAAELDHHPRPSWARVRWLDLARLEPHTVEQLRQRFGFHTLTAEDVLHIPQRPRVEVSSDHLFVVCRLLRIEAQRLVVEQVSALLFEGTLLTIREYESDVWAPVLSRISAPDSRLRQAGADFLLYTLLDAIVDHCFPILERYSDLLEELEEAVMSSPDQRTLHRIQVMKRELGVIRRVMWPTREVVRTLAREEVVSVQPETRTYLRDVEEHSVHIIDILELLRETCQSLTDLYMSTVSNRMNEIMKVLTIMATLFIPITFLAGVYGMNFVHMPELHERWSYPVFWGTCLLITGILLLYFRRKGWLGGSSRSD
jgi:magnesium transporter